MQQAIVQQATVQQAAEATGWSPRMLRYLEQRGLVTPRRSGGGYRLYGPVELQRLVSLRSLLEQTGLELADVAVALRLRREPSLRAAVERWLDGVPEPAVEDRTGEPPEEPGDALDALRWEQERDLRLLRSGQASRNNVKDALVHHP